MWPHPPRAPHVRALLPILGVCLALSVAPATAGPLVLGPCNTISISMLPGPFVLCDLNGDFDPDIVTVEAGLDRNQVAVLLGQGDGTFAAAVRYTAGAWPRAVATVDLNGDAKLDVLTCDYLDGTVSVLFGRGDGTLDARVSFPVGVWPLGLVARDLTGDGICDFATTQGGNIVLRRGTGSGAFAPEVLLPTSTLGLTGLAAGDVNGDQRLDLVAISSHFGILSYLAGTASGGFDAAINSSVDLGVNSILMTDLDHDGFDDVIVGGSDESSLCSGFGATRLGGPNGLSPAGASFGNGCGTMSLALGDLDMDGQFDVAAGNAGSLELFQPPSVALRHGLGNGAFESMTGAQACGGRYVAIGDLNHDGWPDLVTARPASNDIYVQLNQTGPPIVGVEPPDTQRTLSASTSPNPARGDVTVRFTLPRASEATVRVFDAAGRLVQELAGGSRESGAHALGWDRRTRFGAMAPPGLYLFEVRCGNDRISSSVLLLK